MKPTSHIRSALAGSVALLSAASTFGDVHYVAVDNVTPVAPYTNWVTAATNIQDAVDVATVDDVVLVNDGVYATGGVAIYGTMTNRVAVTKAVRVQSVNGPAVTMIVGQGPAGDGAVRSAYLTNGAVLTGFTLTNGCTQSGISIVETSSGGGVWCEMDALVSDCILTGNWAALSGGGAYGGTLSNCTVTGNATRNRGAGAAYATLNNCILTANHGGLYGGGAASCILNNCTITGNSSTWQGGGAIGGTLNNCLVSSNSTKINGGGTYNSTLTNCTVTGNTVEKWLNNGAVASPAASRVLTMDSYEALDWKQWHAEGGGGVYGGTLVNCIVYRNFAAFGANWYRNSFDGISLDHCCTSPLPPGDGNIDTDPMFVSAEDFHLQAASPCINAGVNQDWMVGVVDLDGHPRIPDDIVDMGAYERFGLHEALDERNLSWTTGGDAPWFAQTAVSTDGVDAAQSGPIGDNAETWFQTPVTSSGYLSFCWRVSCEARYDTLTFYVDGAMYRSITGQTEWQTMSVFVPPGAHTFRWSYRKGKSGAAGADCGWVDDVSWTPGIPGAIWKLTVVSTNDCGTPTPDVGAYSLTNGETVAASVTSPFVIEESVERRRCTGWERTGILPATGDGTATTFTMTTDATLIWLWRTQFWLSTEILGQGTVDWPDDWYNVDSTVTLTGTPNPGWRFDHWSGDVSGTTIQGCSITVPINKARHLLANFVTFALAEALDTTNLTWTTGGDAPWTPQKTITWDGVDAAVSGPITDLGDTWLQTTVIGPGTLTFHWRCDSETGYDYLDFLVDGEVWSWLTGDTGWNTASFVLGAGQHTLCWDYWKDESTSAGMDAGWVDHVTWTGSVPVGFAAWSVAHGLNGTSAELFGQDRDADGVANGFEYTFGTNWTSGQEILNLRLVDGQPVVEVPKQDASTTPYVILALRGCTNLLCAPDDWNLPTEPASNMSGMPANRDWYVPVGSPGNAFFRVRASMLP